MRSLLLCVLTLLAACPPSSTGPTSTLPSNEPGAVASEEATDECGQAGGSPTPGYCSTPCSDSAVTGTGTCADGFRCDVSSMCIHTTIGACLACASN